MVDLLYIEHIKQLHWFCSDSGHREAFVYYDGKEYSVKMVEVEKGGRGGVPLRRKGLDGPHRRDGRRAVLPPAARRGQPGRLDRPQTIGRARSARALVQ